MATPIRLIASAAKAPHSSLSCKATEVPTACAVTPSDMPRASGLCTPSRVSSAGPKIAPITPVINTNTAASAATPPICSATSMAIGEVTDFGAMVIRIMCSAPNHQPSSRQQTVANRPPTTSVVNVGQNSWRIRRRLR
ncbi:hypothetical protein D3C76_1237580 [compost metagenome]